MLDWRVACKALRAETSFCRVAIAACREWDCETREWVAASDCVAWFAKVSASVLETACRRASFSGFGGIGGAGPVGANDGSPISKGDVRRSGAWVFGAGAAGGGCG